MWNDVVDEAEPPVAGCSWPIVGECPAALDDEVATWTQQMAIDILWRASGRQFGLCASTYQPCGALTECGFGRGVDAWDLVGEHRAPWDPWSDALLAQVRCGGCTGDCRCTEFDSIKLWHRRVRSVTEVVIDGMVLDPANYRLRRDLLIRTDGLKWPNCQDLTVDVGEVGTWTVSYVHGRPVPVGGSIAAGILACQLGLALSAPDDCALPKHVQSVTRQGVSVSFLDPMQFLKDGETGVYEVDLWLASVNPNRLVRRARVMSARDPARWAKMRS